MASRQLDEEAIFHVARDIGNLESRAKYLDQICAGDMSLRNRVEELLQVHESDFLKSSSEPAPTVDQPPIAERAGTSIGRYRLMEQIGEGGMGVVFVAEQQRPIQRKVALKIIKPGMDTKAVIARFEVERQALAMMDHPNIAKVFDAGTTDSGRPFFVMELVRGVPITEYCDENKLSIAERLELFTQVCQAIQHAHQKGVMHRDIKPSNVLVTLHDDKPVIKVIDFGVAKAVSQRLTEQTVYTGFAQAIGTPLYMSPEQAGASGLDIDTRTDVYSLGVLLYELLTGTTPFDKQELDKAAYEEVRRIIREREPAKPSTRISTLGATLESVSAQRKMDPQKLCRLMRGDLDWIVMKSLEKDRQRRYETASSLAADVRRFLDDEPVNARAPSASYRLQKFVRRNRGLTLATATVVLALVAGIFGTASGWRTADISRKQAEQARRELAGTVDKLDLALEKWQEELFRRALRAAFAGDKAKVEAILHEARDPKTGDAPSWESKILGQLALFGGEIEKARAILTASLKETPDDIGSLALLSLAHLEAGDHDNYLMRRSQLERVKASSPLSRFPVPDRLLLAEAEMFGDIRAGLDTLDSLMGEYPSALTMAFQCEAAMKLAIDVDEGKERLRETAFRNLDAARLMMPNSAYLDKIQFWLNFSILLEGDESPERQQVVKGAVERLAQYPMYPGARHARAIYFDHIGETDKAREEWKSISNMSAGGWMLIYYAAFEYRNGNRPKAIQLLDQASTHTVWGQLLVGEVLALENDGRQRARRSYERALDYINRYAFQPNDFVGLPETILLLLGEQEEATRRIKERLASGDRHPCQKVILEFAADPSMHPDELLDAINGNYNRVVAHKVIALRHLSRGEFAQAEEHLKMCQQACPLQPAAYWADSILRRLQTDTAWREQLAVRYANSPPAK